MRSTTLLILILLLLPAGVAAQSALILPGPSYATTGGNANNYYPFGHTTMRYQQIYDQQIMGGPSLFRFMQLRANQQFGQNDGGYTADLEMTLGVSPNSPTNYSMTWAANNPNPNQVLKRKWIFMPKLVRWGVQDWLITIPFDLPFPWAGTGHMVMEVKIYGNSDNRQANLALDAATGSNVLACRLWGTSLTSTSASGSQKNQALVMRLSMVPAPVPLFTFFGAACPGSNNTAMHYYGEEPPYLGSTFTVGAAGAAGGIPMALVVGNRRDRWGPLALPFDLTPLGAKGCSLYTPGVLLVSTTAGSTGTAETKLTIPSDKALQGMVLYTQWYGVDTKANALGLVTSRGGEVRLEL